MKAEHSWENCKKGTLSEGWRRENTVPRGRQALTITSGNNLTLKSRHITRGIWSLRWAKVSHCHKSQTSQLLISLVNASPSLIGCQKRQAHLQIQKHLAHSICCPVWDVWISTRICGTFSFLKPEKKIICRNKATTGTGLSYDTEVRIIWPKFEVIMTIC